MSQVRARHDSVVATSCCDGGNVHLQEFRRVSGTVLLLRQVRAELGRPCHSTEVIRERSKAYPGRRGARLYPGVHRRLGCHHVQLSIEVAALSTEMRASSPARLRLSSAGRSSVRAPLVVGERTDADAPPWRWW